MILNSLPRNKTYSSFKRPMDPEERARRKRVKSCEPFDKDAFREVKKIVQDPITEKEELYTTALQSLPPEKPLEGDQNPEMNRIMHPGPAVTMEKVRQIVSNEISGPSALEPLSSSDPSPDQDSELENCHILELEPFCKRAVDLGLLDLRLKRARQDRPSLKDFTGGRRWEYSVTKSMSTKWVHSRPTVVNCCHIGFKKDEDVRDGMVWVKIEVNPPGQRHAECYATKTLDSDPASRLAFRVRYKNSRGEQQEIYAHTQGRKSLYAANTLVDDDRPNEMIAKTLRRYLYFTLESKFPEELKRFIGSAYTADI